MGENATREKMIYSMIIPFIIKRLNETLAIDELNPNLYVI